MKVKHLLLSILATSCVGVAYADELVESSPVHKVKHSTKATEAVGEDSLAPVGKYVDSQKPVIDIPAFEEGSRSTAADVPLSPYLTLEYDLDPEGLPGRSFSNASIATTIGVDKILSNTNFSFGAWLQQVLPIKGMNSSIDPTQTTQVRLYGAYSAPFGLFTSVAVDNIYNANFAYQDPIIQDQIDPSTNDANLQRIELFNRYNTQFSKQYYFFVGQKDRADTGGGYNVRIFGGTGINFTDRDNWETALNQTWYNNNRSPAGIYPIQTASSQYSHTFANKIAAYANIQWQGSSYQGTTYSNSLGFETGVRFPF